MFENYCNYHSMAEHYKRREERGEVVWKILMIDEREGVRDRF
jgi:hypothetical protein